MAVTDRIMVAVIVQFRNSLKAKMVSIIIHDAPDYNNQHCSTTTSAVVSVTIAAIVAATSHRVVVVLRTDQL